MSADLTDEEQFDPTDQSSHFRLTRHTITAMAPRTWEDKRSEETSEAVAMEVELGLEAIRNNIEEKYPELKVVIES